MWDLLIYRFFFLVFFKYQNDILIRHKILTRYMKYEKKLFLFSYAGI